MAVRLVRLALIVLTALLQVNVFRTNVYVALTGDMVHYNHEADLLLQKQVLAYWYTAPSAQVTPGYPMFLALCKWIAPFTPFGGGEHLRFIILIQGMLFVGTCLFVFEITRHFASLRWASLAAFLFALYLPAIHSTERILTESLYVFFLCMFVWLVIQALVKPSTLRWAGVGLTLGACTLVRPTPFPLVLCLLLYFGVQVRKHRFRLLEALQYYAACVIGFLLFLVPWWVRNWLAFHKVILTSDDVGNPLLYGSMAPWQQLPSVTGLTADDQKQMAIHNIVQEFTHHPLGYAKWCTVDKLAALFGKPWYPEHSAISWWLNLHILWVILGLLGLVFSWRLRNVRWLGLIVLFLILAQLPFIPLPRYAYPVMPLLFVGVGLLGETVEHWCKFAKSRVSTE